MIISDEPRMTMTQLLAPIRCRGHVEMFTSDSSAIEDDFRVLTRLQFRIAEYRPVLGRRDLCSDQVARMGGFFMGIAGSRW
jgi:hypothetical protein